MKGLDNGALLHVTEYPTAWRAEVVNDGLHRGFEYLRWEPDITQHTRMAHTAYSFFWGPAQKIMNLYEGNRDNGSKVRNHH